MRTGLTKQEKTTDIWFDEKDPLIHIRTHNTDLKNRLTAYAAAYPGGSPVPAPANHPRTSADPTARLIFRRPKLDARRHAGRGTF